MKRFVLILAVVVVSIVTISLSASPKPTTAGVAWQPLQNCPDLNGDGAVSGLDLFAMISSAGSVYSATATTSDYLYLYDRNGDQSITLTDFLNVLSSFGERCPLVDTQVALATLATIKYQNCQDALNDGYEQYTQFVPNMGIHLSKKDNVTQYPEFYREDGNDQLRHPVGLICTDSDPSPGTDVAHKLIGMWYASPIPTVCPYYGLDPVTCSSAEPVGFGLTNTDEDNTDLSGFQKGWHDHGNLCIWGIGTEQAGTLEGMSLSTCNSQPQPSLHFPLFGWMAHLYNHIPNDSGRFMMWGGLLPPGGG